MILFILSLVAGVLTVLAPCTISLLPVIVGGSVGGGTNRKRALVITLSLGASVILFTLLLKYSTSLINIPQSFWEYVSGIIIFALGLTMVFPELWEKFSFANKMNKSSNRLLATGYKKEGFWGDVIMGAALGPVFSSCSPTYFLIIATVLPRSLAEGLIYLLAYTVGLCGGLLVVTLLSQKIIEKLGLAADPKGWLKRVVGILFVILGIAIFFGLDKQAELFASDHFFDVTKVELALQTNLNSGSKPEGLLPAAQTGTASEPMPSASSTASTPTTAPTPTASTMDMKTRIAAKSLMYPMAPEITNPSGFINTDPAGAAITIGQFREKKIVLVDFWTYSCINCQRSLPYVKAWYDKYHDQGLEIISIHTPEFSFEKVQSNVAAAVKTDGVQYPVVMDNDYGTWNAFQNQYWPRDYLIDIDGFIVHDHAGEGDYDVTEKAIQAALAERAKVLGDAADMPTGGIVAPKDAVTSDGSLLGSPETYFGSNRNVYLANGAEEVNATQNLTLPSSFELNKLYLSGTWNFVPEYAETTDATAKIVYKYQAKNLYFVASSPGTAHVKILIDGKAPGAMAGADINADGTAAISANRLYKLVQGTDYSQHTIEIDVLDGTLDAYTFTFG